MWQTFLFLQSSFSSADDFTYLSIYLFIYEFQCTIRLSLILVFEVKSNTVREPSLGAGTVVQKPRGQGT